MARVQLLVTCLGDLVFPDAVADAERLLRAAGFDVEVPAGQVCCGQPAFNAGHRKAARRVARTVARSFDRDALVVVPSGSCASMVRDRLPELVGCEPFDVHELSAFLDANDVPLGETNAGKTIAFHDACHALRELGIADEPRRLLERSGYHVVTASKNRRSHVSWVPSWYTIVVPSIAAKKLRVPCGLTRTTGPAPC